MLPFAAWSLSLRLQHGNACKLKQALVSLLYRIGTYSGHSGRIIQLMTLGDVLLSLGTDRKLMVWADGVYDAPKVLLSTVQCMHEETAPGINSGVSQMHCQALR